MISEFALPEGVFQPRYLPGEIDKPFWEGLKEGRLLLQQCSQCGTFQWLPEVLCNKCLSKELEFSELNPVATLHSWIRVVHPPSTELISAVPYIVIAAQLVDQPQIRLIGNYVGAQTDALEIGMALKGVFEHHGGKYSLLQWTAAAEA
jgi:uncharacterized OB-fold protein